MALTGYLLNQTCVYQPDDAILVFAAQYPAMQNGVMYSINSIGFSNPSSLNVVFNVDDVLHNTALVQVSKSINLLLCDPEISIPQGMIFNAATASEFWAFGLIFVLGSWLVASNAGMIINAIRRW